LQNVNPIPYAEIQVRKFELLRKKPNSKLLIFDLDETLAHCTAKSPEMNPDVLLDLKLKSKKLVGFNIRPYTT